MFTKYTYQDWEKERDRLSMLRTVINAYVGSDEFRYALTAQNYFRGENEEVARKVVLRPQHYERRDGEGRTMVGIGTKEIAGNRISSNYLFRFITQQNQYLLSYGVTLGDASHKERLGKGFDKALESMGEYALVQGLCWGFWNADHLEIIPAARDQCSGLVALLDEMTGLPRLAIQFWRLSDSRPLYVRLFEEDGVTVYRTDEKGQLTPSEPKRAYKQIVRSDAAGESVVGAENWSALPVIPLYANTERRSELTFSLKAKIDAYDRILSDFGDNLDRANDVYWVLNNFGGTMKDILEMLEQIQQIRAVANFSDGTGGGSTAEPRTIEVPYAARQTALVLLEKAMYADYMALSMDELTGGSLTNVAIEAAKANLNLKADRYEWQVFSFVRQVLLLNGIDTDEISFKRQGISNDYETVQAIYTMRDDLDRETALRLNPYIQDDMIDGIIENLTAEEHTGMPSMAALQNEIDTVEASGEGQIG